MNDKVNSLHKNDTWVLVNKSSNGYSSLKMKFRELKGPNSRLNWWEGGSLSMRALITMNYFHLF